MPIKGLMANLACTDLSASEKWFAMVFGRPADAHPMDGLAEWHLPPHGFQLHEDTDKAGSGTLTLMVEDLTAERARLRVLDPGPVEAASALNLVRLDDPDGNLVVLVGLKMS